MSANRDKSQKFRFLYQNLYQIYRTGVDEAKKAPVPPAFIPKAHEAYQKAGLTSGVVLKSPEIPVFYPRDLKKSPLPSEPNEPGGTVDEVKAIAAEMQPMPIAIGLKAREERRKAQLESLRDQLGELSTLQKKIRFMLKEIEELSEPTKKS